MIDQAVVYIFKQLTLTPIVRDFLSLES